MNATRLYSCLYGNKLSVGRVQTPTLNLIVEREDKIQNFKPEKYYEIIAQNGELKAKTEKIESLEKAKEILELVQNSPFVCTEFQKTQTSKACPKLYDLTTLQREANKIFGYSANETLNILQNLYEKKITTYPRTDSKYISDDMQAETKEIINILYKNLNIKESVICNINQITNNEKITDHHAILPTKNIANINNLNLSEQEQNIFQLICKILLQAVHEKSTFDETKGVLSSNDIEFKFTNKVLKSKGYLSIEDYFSKDKQNQEKNIACPAFEKGEQINNLNVSLEEKETTPPKRYTEDTLLLAMENVVDYKDLENSKEIEKIEKKGLGTPATRASIIEKLIQTEYIERKGKNLIPTEKGKNLIQIIDENLKSPKLTAQWESKLQQIEQNKYSDEVFLDEIKDFITNIVKDFSVDENLKEKLKKETNLECLGHCPICSKNVYEREKVFCCEDKNCKFVIFKNSKFFTKNKAKIKKKNVIEILEKGKTKMEFYSETKGRYYEVNIVPEYKEENKYISYRMEF